MQKKFPHFLKPNRLIFQQRIEKSPNSSEKPLNEAESCNIAYTKAKQYARELKQKGESKLADELDQDAKKAFKAFEKFSSDKPAAIKAKENLLARINIIKTSTKNSSSETPHVTEFARLEGKINPQNVEQAIEEQTQFARFENKREEITEKPGTLLSVKIIRQDPGINERPNLSIPLGMPITQRIDQINRTLPGFPSGTANLNLESLPKSIQFAISAKSKELLSQNWGTITWYDVTFVNKDGQEETLHIVAREDCHYHSPEEAERGGKKGINMPENLHKGTSNKILVSSDNVA